MKFIIDDEGIQLFFKDEPVVVGETAGPHGYRLNHAVTGKFVGWMSKIDCDLFDFAVKCFERKAEKEKQKMEWMKKTT